MVIKNIIFNSALLFAGCTSKTYALPLKPLCQPTLFSATFDDVMSIWNAIVCGEGGTELEERLKAVYALTSVLQYQNEMIHAGNIEYLLSIFDGLERSISHTKSLLMITSIKKKLIELL